MIYVSSFVQDIRLSSAGRSAAWLLADKLKQTHMTRLGSAGHKREMHRGTIPRFDVAGGLAEGGGEKNSG
jgi:hypothetical protein